MVYTCTNNFSMTSGEVSNYYINWSKASFDILITDIQEQNNVLHIYWLCCKNTCKNLGWHAKEQAFVIWFWEKPMCLDALLFRKPMHKERQFFSFKHSMLDPLEEPMHSAPNLYGSYLAPSQNSFHGNWIWQLHHNGFGLITLSSFILLITFLAILDFINSVHISSRQSNAPYIYDIYIFIYISLYLPVKGNTRIYLK